MGRMRGRGDGRVRNRHLRDWRLRDGRRVALFGAIALYASFLGGLSCASHYHETLQVVTVEVRNAEAAPVADALVTPWIVDVTMPPDLREPTPLEARLTDADGVVSWDVESTAMPYVCGYEITDASGTNTLAARAPRIDQAMSTTDGFLSVTLP